MFPDGGVPGLQSYVKLPFVLHNRWFSVDNWYKKNIQNITGPWTENAVAAEGRAGKMHVATLPFDLRSFWQWFFKQQEGFGMAVYEQDFLYSQYDRSVFEHGCKQLHV